MVFLWFSQQPGRFSVVNLWTDLPSDAHEGTVSDHLGLVFFGGQLLIAGWWLIYC